jgi:hypothetical protein
VRHDCDLFADLEDLTEFDVRCLLQISSRRQDFGISEGSTHDAVVGNVDLSLEIVKEFGKFVVGCGQSSCLVLIGF